MLTEEELRGFNQIADLARKAELGCIRSRGVFGAAKEKSVTAAIFTWKDADSAIALLPKNE